MIGYAGVLELVDGADSKSVVLSGVWVRVPPPAPKRVFVELIKNLIQARFKKMIVNNTYKSI